MTTNQATESQGGQAQTATHPEGHMTAQSETSVRNASITAGVALLLMSALAGFGNFVSLKGLVTRNAAQTANNITGPRACSGSVP
jgi:hypothetical protein